MQLKKYLQAKLPAVIAIGLALGLTSCGSYQYVGQNSDGIYSDDERPVQVVQADTKANDNNNYYKNYFKEKSLEMEAGTLENEVFVDIDSYQGNYSDDGTQNEGYAAWGDNGTEVSINVYDNGWGFYNSWNRPFWGWNRWGWNRPYAGWNIGFGYAGFGWNTGFYDPFFCPPFYGYGYGYGYNNSYYGSYYNRNRYGRNGLAYNSTRRNSSILNRRSRLTRPSHSTSTRTRTRISPNTRGINSSNNSRRTRANSSSNRTPSRSQGTTRSRTRTNGKSTPSRPTRSRANSSTPRTNNRSYSPSRSSTRSSGSSRSSSSRSGSRRRG